MIKKLLHFSDLHIRLFKDHDLYRSILEDAINQWKEIKVPVPEYKDSFIIKHDTVIETEKLIITRKGDFFGVTVKPDTLTFRDTIAYEVKVPGRIAYIDKINWWYVVISFISGIFIALYLRR